MHEPAIAAELIELAQREIAQAGHPHATVTSITIRIGALRGVVGENLRLAFDVLKLDTPLANAEITIEHSPVRGSCRRCGADFEPTEPIFLCASCGSGDLEIRQGNELDLESMTIETE